jgi:hypothetical protein
VAEDDERPQSHFVAVCPGCATTRPVPITMIGQARLSGAPVIYVWGTCPWCGTKLRYTFERFRMDNFEVADADAFHHAVSLGEAVSSMHSETADDGLDESNSEEPV